MKFFILLMLCSLVLLTIAEDPKVRRLDDMTVPRAVRDVHIRGDRSGGWGRRWEGGYGGYGMGGWGRGYGGYGYGNYGGWGWGKK